jgi:hypothetical protein
LISFYSKLLYRTIPKTAPGSVAACRQRKGAADPAAEKMGLEMEKRLKEKKCEHPMHDAWGVSVHLMPT